MSKPDPHHVCSPRFSRQEVSKFVRQLYGTTLTAIRELDSYTDQNFYLRDGSGREFVFKISNSAEEKEVLDFQHLVLDHLAQHKEIGEFPRVCTGLSGDRLFMVFGPDRTSHFVRLVTFLPGTFMSQVQPHTPELLYNLGYFLGSLDKALVGLCHGGAHRYVMWDIKNFRTIKPKLDCIEDRQRRTLVQHFLWQFETFVVPALPDLRKSIIHSDGNDRNVLLREGDPGSWRVIGIIDFGDMVHTYTICELAVAIAYAILDKNDVLKAAAQVTAGYHQAFPLMDRELEVLFFLVCARLCISVCLSAYRQKLETDNEYLKRSEEPAWAALDKLIRLDPRQAQRIFRAACGLDPDPKSAGRSSQEILDLRRRNLGRNLSVSYQRPLKIVRGFGQYLYDDTGRAYLDCVNNVCHVGHCHPRLVKAAREQMVILNTNTRYLHDNIVEYAHRLGELLPEPLRVCFFVNSGSEANDLALRLARTHTRCQDIIVVDHAYHGNLSSLIEISPYKFDGPGGRGAPSHVHKVPLPDVYRGLYKATDPQAGQKYGRHVGETLEGLQHRGKKPAAFICESLPGVAGQIVLPKNYLRAAYQHARQAGAVCIADEVQVGFGRMGTHFWGFETQAVVPDIVTLGKPIGNGHPLAAVVTTPEIAESFNNGMEYFNTFGGNPVSCAVGLAVLDIIREERLQENALEVGAYLKKGLQKIMDRHLLIGDVRGLGLFIGVELVKDRHTLEPAGQEAVFIIERMKESGVLLSIDGPLHNVLKIKPPIVFTRENADFLIHTLDQVLSEL